MRTRNSRSPAFAAAVIGGLALSGCSTLAGAGGAAPDIYDISAAAPLEVAGEIAGQLLVPEPAAVAALANNRIAVRPDAARIAYYPDAVWSDELPALVQLKLVRAFENSGRARAVGRPGESLAIDYQVIVDLRAFEIDAAGGETAHVVFGVKLLDDWTGLVRASRVVEVRLPAPSADTAAGAVAALDAAADQAMAEVVAWTARTI